jgi:hypothetical protein
MRALPAILGQHTNDSDNNIHGTNNWTELHSTFDQDDFSESGKSSSYNINRSDNVIFYIRNFWT